MKFDDIFLNKRDLKMLKCLKYHNANIWELHGYFNFPGIEDILMSIGKLQAPNLIIENTINDVQWYSISSVGRDYLLFDTKRRRTRMRKGIIAILGAIASLVAIAEFVLPALLRWLQ